MVIEDILPRIKLAFEKQTKLQHCNQNWSKSFSSVSLTLNILLFTYLHRYCYPKYNQVVWVTFSHATIWFRYSLNIVYIISSLNLIFDTLKCTLQCYDCFDKQWVVKDIGDTKIFLSICQFILPHFKYVSVLKWLDFKFSKKNNNTQIHIQIFNHLSHVRVCRCIFFILWLWALPDKSLHFPV